MAPACKAEDASYKSSKNALGTNRTYDYHTLQYSTTPPVNKVQPFLGFVSIEHLQSPVSPHLHFRDLILRFIRVWELELCT